MKQPASTTRGDFVSSNSPAETNIKIHFVPKKIHTHQENIFSDIPKCAKTTKEMKHVGSMTNVPIRIVTKRSMLKNLSKIMKKKLAQ